MLLTLNCTLLYSTVLYCTLLYFTVRGCVEESYHNRILISKMHLSLNCTLLLYSTLLYSTVLVIVLRTPRSTVTILHNNRHCTHLIVLYCTLLYSTVLNCLSCPALSCAIGALGPLLQSTVAGMHSALLPHGSYLPYDFITARTPHSPLSLCTLSISTHALCTLSLSALTVLLPHHTSPPPPPFPSSSTIDLDHLSLWCAK